MLYLVENLLKWRQREHGYRLLIRDLAIGHGAKVALTGPSGCGKSTTLDILGLSLRPDSASSFLFDAGGNRGDILPLWQKNRLDLLAGLRLESIGYVLQSGELLPFLTAGENMALTARLSGMEPQEAEDSARTLAEQLGIGHLAKAMPATLSVGERQRAAIVRALAPHPRVILADEPTAALDPLHAARVMDVFLKILDEFGSTLVLATHNSDWAKAGGLEEASFRLEEDDGRVTAILDFRSSKGGAQC